MRGFLSFFIDSILPLSCLVCGRDLTASAEAHDVDGRMGTWDDLESESLFFEPIEGIRLPARVLCPECWGLLEPARSISVLIPRPSPVPLVSPFRTNDTLLALVRFLKFSGGRSAVPLLGWQMASSLRGLLERDRRERAEHVLIPVPLHPRRLVERGYDQALLLAEDVGRRLGLRVEGSAVIRARNTASQSKLEERARAENVRGAFRLSRPELIAKQHIILVDDLVTTGETARACLESLAGADLASAAVLSAGRARDSCLTGDGGCASIAPALFESPASKGGNRAFDEQGSAHGRPRRRVWGRSVQHK